MFVSKEAYQEAIQRLLDHNEAQEELLQAKDAQIKQLVTALRIAEWSGVAQWGISPRCPKCFVGRGKEHRADCEIGNAIKEATNG